MQCAAGNQRCPLLQTLPGGWVPQLVQQLQTQADQNITINTLLNNNYETIDYLQNKQINTPRGYNNRSKAKTVN